MTFDPTFPLLCPYCGAKLLFDGTRGDTAFYDCRTCGTLALPPSHSLRRLTEHELNARLRERMLGLFEDGPGGKPRHMH